MAYLDHDGEDPWITISAEKADPLSIVRVFRGANFLALDDIVFVTSTYTNMNKQLTDSCRRSVIPGVLAYSPIAFNEYNPIIVAEDLAKSQSKLSPKVGYFDVNRFDDLCIAVSDVNSVELDVGNTATDKLINVQRAVDPGLRKRWSRRTCSRKTNIDTCNISIAESKSLR